VRLRIAPSIEAIGRDLWDLCANPPLAAAEAMAPCADEAEPVPEREAYNPFISYDFLHALERSGSVG